MSTKIESKFKKKSSPAEDKPKKIPVELNLDMSEDETLSQEEAFAKIALILGETKNPKLLTELDDYEIKLASALFAVSENVSMHDVAEEEMIKKFLENFLKLRVSHKRQGRRELLEIAKSAREIPEQRFSRLRNIFGLGNK